MSTRGFPLTCGSNQAWCWRYSAPSSHSHPTTLLAGGSSRKTPGCRCGFLDSPAGGVTTKSRRTRQPLSSSSSFIALHAGRLPLEGKAPNGN